MHFLLYQGADLRFWNLLPDGGLGRIVEDEPLISFVVISEDVLVYIMHDDVGFWLTGGTEVFSIGTADWDLDLVG